MAREARRGWIKGALGRVMEREEMDRIADGARGGPRRGRQFKSEVLRAHGLADGARGGPGRGRRRYG